MILCTLDDAVTDWIIDYPETELVFQRLGLDYSCSGKSLKYVCYEQGLDAQPVLQMLCEIIEHISGR